ncbi:MAG: hypothetical protein LBU09_01545 [Endomicrobium sp.]|nr:hypothetical protein [Endomicrobium sp.]
MFLLCCEKAISAVRLFDAENAFNSSANLPTAQTQIENLRKLQKLINIPTDIISSFLTDDVSVSIDNMTASSKNAENEKEGTPVSEDKNDCLMDGSAFSSYANIFQGKHLETDGRRKDLLYGLTLCRTQNQKNTMAEIFLFLIILMLMTVMKGHAVSLSLQNRKNVFYYIRKGAF